MAPNQDLQAINMSQALIKALMSGKFFKEKASTVELIETHISWILLTGKYAYKIKKPVDFGFLDFTTLTQRKQYCEAELNLNRRSAPGIYLGICPISGSAEQPEIDSTAAPIEYAIKMRRFESGKLFSELADKQALDHAHIDELAQIVAEFHGQLEATPATSPFGEPAQVYAPMRQNFQQISELLDDDLALQDLKELEAWSESSFERLKPYLVERKRKHFVKDCHGDMHLGNITVFQGKVTLFDCIEFNDDFRWIDVISDIAFLIMDFEVNGLAHYGNRLLNDYLEETGDYGGLRVLNFYKMYRALVRAKISLLTAADKGAPAALKREMEEDFKRYMDLAESYTRLPSRLVITMHGISGTGKSTVAQRLVDQVGAIRIRSDVERKRLYGCNPHEHPDQALARRMYSDQANHRTYEHLARLCYEVLDSGLSVIVDATNLKKWQRDLIQSVAESRGVPVCIAYCKASMSVIRKWINKRRSEDHDPSDANLEVAKKQVVDRDSLDDEELRHTFVIHSDILKETQDMVDVIKRRYLN